MPSNGFTNIVVASNGVEAVAAAKKDKFDIILMDIMVCICSYGNLFPKMPEMDGEEATRLIREFEIAMNLKPTRILALTADVTNVERYLIVGFDFILTKPVHKSKLIDIIEKAL